MLKGKDKRKICFVITSEIHYARNKLILEALRARKDVDIQIAVGASAILPAYGDVPTLLARDKFPCSAKIMMTFEGGTPLAMAKTAGYRCRGHPTAIAAANLNVPVAHIEGGDSTGTRDESVHHAITKLSHIHF